MADVLHKVDKRQGGIKKKSCRIEPTLTRARVNQNSGAPEVNKEEIFNSGWNKLENFLQETFVPLEQLRMPNNAKYIELFNEVQKICVAPVSPGICPGLHRHDKARVELPKRLYGNLKSFFRDHLRRIGAAGSEIRGNIDTLNFYSNQCRDFDASSKILNGICQYLNRTWITQERMAKQNGIRDIYELALCTWRDTLFGHLKEKVTDSILEIITIDRDSGTNQFSHAAEITQVIQSFINMGLLGEDVSSNKHLRIYCKYFEDQFLEATRTYYAGKLNEILKVRSPEISIQMIEGIVMQEEARAQELMHESTLKKVVRECVETLALNQLESFYTVLRNLLERKNEQGLRSFYQVMKRISPQQVSQMAFRFQKIVADIANEQLRKDMSSILFCNKMFGLISTYENVIRDCFENSMEFRVALGESCSNFVNSDTGSLSKMPEHLARYTNNIFVNTDMSKNEDAMSEEEVQQLELQQNKLQKVLKLIPLVNDKDLLARLLKHHYGNRLLWGTSSRCLKMERKFVEDLAEHFSSDYARRLSQMDKDTIHSSEWLSKEFNDQLEAPLGFTFQPYVLSLASWCYPIPVEPSAFVFPEVFREAMEQFRAFYITDDRKKLVWLPYKAGGEMEFHIGDKSYQITASTYEMTILLLFNNVDEYNMTELKEATKLEDDKLEQVVANLIYSKILKLITPTFSNCNIEPRSPASVFIQKVIDEIQQNREIAIIQFNDQFQSASDKLKFNFPLRADVICGLRAS